MAPQVHSKLHDGRPLGVGELVRAISQRLLRSCAAIELAVWQVPSATPETLDLNPESKPCISTSRH